jgi:hypothetical protein
MAPRPQVIDHWHAWYEGVNFSPLEFYADLEEALKHRQIPEATISRITWKESGLISSRREYLRITRGRLTFDICAAPFGTDFFFSWWLAHVSSWTLGLVYSLVVLGLLALLLLPGVLGGGCFGALAGLGVFTFLMIVFGVAIRAGTGDEEAVLAMPYLGRLYERIFQPVTYFAVDTETMFQSVVHAAVLEVIDQWTSAKGLRSLSEGERKPRGKEMRHEQAA